MKLKNQFRTLDEDEVEFLESINESSRAKEAATLREEKQQIDAFRQLQGEAERAVPPSKDPTIDTVEAWTTSSKKRKPKSELKRGAWKRRTSSSSKAVESTPRSDEHSLSTSSPKGKQAAKQVSESAEISTLPTSVDPGAVSPSSKPPLGLAGYSSSDDE